MPWFKIISISGILIFIFGIAAVDYGITGDIDLSGTWALTEISEGCGDNKIENYKAEITQIGNTVKLSIIDGNREMIGEIYNNEVLFEGIRKIIPAEGSLLERKYEYDEYKLRICEDANILIGKSKWHFSTSTFNCDGISKILYTRN